MKTILVDDENMNLMLLRNDCSQISYIEVVGEFRNSLQAQEYAEKNPVDLAILDIRMAEIDGITLGKYLKKLYPDILLIYTTGYEEYAIDAVKMNAVAYLLKPFSPQDIEYAIESAMLLSKRIKKKHIFAKTFGHFDLYINDTPVIFKSSKAKELLAFLIDRRGGVVTTSQIISALWEDRPNDELSQNLCSKTAKTLKEELQSFGIEDILIYNRGSRRIDTEKLDSDLFDFLDRKQSSEAHFSGEYMSDYSWGETTIALLNEYD